MINLINLLKSIPYSLCNNGLPFLTLKLRLTVVDTPGFGDGLEGNGSWKACVKYVDDQFAAYFDGESGKKKVLYNTNSSSLIQQNDLYPYLAQKVIVVFYLIRSQSQEHCGYQGSLLPVLHTSVWTWITANRS